MLGYPIFVISLLALIFLAFLILGRFTFKVLKIGRFLMPNTFINIPVYGSTGLVVSLLFLNFVGVFTIGIPSLVFFFIFLAFAFFVLVRSGDFNSLFSRLKKMTWASLLMGGLPLFLIMFTFFHFSNVISIMGWPPIGDVLINHGPLTSLLMYNGKIPTSSLEPLSSQQIYYPLGLHVLAANLASWFNLFPGEAVFLLGGLVVILIPILMYSLTYTLTKSIPLSLLVYLSTFIIHPSSNLERWVAGYFYNGPYPNLTAFMIIILSIYMLGLLESGQPEKLKQSLAMGSIAVLFLGLLVLLMVYPNFSIFMAMMTALVILKYREELVMFLRKKPFSTTIPFVLIGGLTFLALPQFYIRSPTIAFDFRSYVYGINQSLGILVEFPYSLSPTFFDYLTGYVICLVVFISLILIYKKRYTLINLFYIILFCVVIFTLSPTTPSILYVILPSRAVIILAIVSWLILALGITEIFKIKRLKMHSHSHINSVLMVILVASLILIPQFSWSIALEFSNTEAFWGSFTRSSSFPSDFFASLWIHYNVPMDNLILNGKSYADFIILELSLKNITYNWQLDQAGLERARELNAIWENPHDSNTVYQLLKKYDVRYILVTSEWGWINSPWLGGNATVPQIYTAKPFKPSEYIQIFDTYPYLKVVFRLGYTTIYKVEF